MRTPHVRFMLSLSAALIEWAACLVAWPAAAGDFVSKSDPLNPDAERATLEVPAGFAIQLVAAEPDIGKPVSLAFDAAGRLWVAETRTYPINSLADKTPRDSVRILSDFAPDGRARGNAVFADGLVMPDAVVPHATGAIVFTAPNIVNLVDADGDGRADRRDTLFGPFDVRDMHNLPNNFRRGFDGWLYGGHGIINTSTITDKAGRTTKLSGATFRFKPDGSQLEVFGQGQANPFGFCFDDLGNFYASDCHSLPIYEIVRGGRYPSFRRPHDGLGFAPSMMSHAHGSTGLAGLCLVDDDLWPEEWRGNMLIGNVVTNRVNRDRIETAGATKTAHELPDLVIGKDPWFRPVDVQLGPDGAIYIADFYNRIIAHVEVPLDHPGRDRERGRIWRVVPVDAAGTPRLRPAPDLVRASPQQLVAALSHPNITVRFVALNRLADIGGSDVIEAAKSEFARSAAGPRGRTATLWILERLAALDTKVLEQAVRDPEPAVRVHALRVLCERPSFMPAERAAVITALGDADPHVQRTAADALGRHPGPDAIGPLLAVAESTAAVDQSLIYMLRKSLRDQLLDSAAFAALDSRPLSAAHFRIIADVCLAIPSPAAAGFLATALADGVVDPMDLTGSVEHAARWLTKDRLPAFIRQLTALQPTDPDRQAAILLEASRGLKARGVTPESMMATAATTIVQALCDAPGDTAQRNSRCARAAELATICNATAAAPRLAMLASDAGADLIGRMAALRAVVALDGEAGVLAADTMLGDASLPVNQRGEIAVILAGAGRPAATTRAADALRTAPAAIRPRLAGALAGSREGATALLDRIELGRAPVELLLDPTVKQKLAATLPGEPRLASLAATAKPPDARLKALIDERAKAYRATKGDAIRGQAVFTAKCNACHNADAQGDKLAPGLVGVGLRGVERLCEDIVAPNRNVDHTFRMSVIALDDGRVMSGLFRREEGAELVFADQTGKDFSLAKDAIETRKETSLSLMPEGFGESLSTQEFNDLLEFLISRSAAE